MNDISRCTEKKTSSKIKVEENKRKAVFLNPSRESYFVSKIDGCLIEKGKISADYLVSKEGHVSVIVELKGSDIKHARDQMLAAVKHENVAKILERKLGFLLICSRCPPFFDSMIAKAKQHFASKYNAGFHVVVNKGEFEIERVASIDGPR